MMPRAARPGSAFFPKYREQVSFLPHRSCLREVHLPESADRVGIENGIEANDSHRFHDRLRDDHAIEWLAVIVAGSLS
jgi:hypothetical protein